MSMILRKISHLKRLTRMGWRATFSSPQIEVVSHKCKCYSMTLPYTWNYVKSYATLQQNEFSIDQRSDFEKLQYKGNGYLKQSEIRNALNELQSKNDISPLNLLMLINSCRKQIIDILPTQCVDLVNEIWEMSKRYAVPMDVSHYNAILSVYQEKNHKFSPDEFLQNMLDQKIEPNRVTYQRLIAAFCQQGDIPSATRILELMDANNLPLCENVFNSLIIGHSEANDMKSATEILDTMKNSGISPSADTYEALLCAYAKRGDIETIRSIMNDLETSDIKLSGSNLLKIFYILAANDHLVTAKEFIDVIAPHFIDSEDIISIILKLVDIHQPMLAMDLLIKTTNSYSSVSFWETFLIKTIITKELPIEDRINICNMCSDGPLGKHIFSITAENIVKTNADPNICIPLFKAWQQKGGEIRTHYFWPLLKFEETANRYDGMLKILKSMIDDFNLIPDVHTLRDYVIPSAFGTWQEAIDVLKSFNIPEENVYIAIVARLLIEKKIKNSIVFMSTYKIKYPAEQLLKLLVKSFIHRNDPTSFLQALRYLDQEPDKINVIPKETIDAAILMLLEDIPIFKYKSLEALLIHMDELKMSISPEVADKIKSFLGERINEDIVSVLEHLSSDTQTQIQTDELFNTPEAADIKILNFLQLRRWFTIHLERQNVDKVIEILKQMEESGYDSLPVYAQAIGLFCDNKRLDEAEYYFNKVKNIESAKLDHYKILKYLTLLMENDRYDDAVDLISSQSELDDSRKMSVFHIKSIVDILTRIAETGDVEKLNKIFDVMTDKNWIQTGARVLKPLVAVHINRNDLPKAVEVFEQMCKQYKVAPNKFSLMKVLIEKEDAKTLQKVTDLCAELFGANDAFSDLGLAFLECNRLQQSRKIFETPGLIIHDKKISKMVNQLAYYEDLEYLGKLPQLVKNVKRMDHSVLYDYILNEYIKKNNWQKSLGLWTEMQECDITPSPQFLNNLMTLLKNNKQNIPFNSDILSIAHDTEKAVVSRDNNADEWAPSNRPNSNISNEERINDSLLVLKDNIKRGKFIRRGNFMVVVNDLIAHDKYEDVKKLGNYMNDQTKSNLYYYQMLSLAHINKYGLKDYFQNIYSILDIKSEFMETHIHYGAIVTALIANPSDLPLVKTWINEHISRIQRLDHLLWNYYVITNSPEQERLWTESMVRYETPIIKPAVDYAIKHEDINLIERIYMKFQSHPHFSESTRATIMRGITIIYHHYGRDEEAMTILRKVLPHYRDHRILYPALRSIELNLNIRNTQTPLTANTVNDQDDPDSKQYSSQEFEAKM